MTEDIAWLERYSVVIVPALAVLEQLGIPVPAVPALPRDRGTRSQWPRQSLARYRGDRSRHVAH